MALGSRGQPMKQISLRSLNYLSDRKKLSPVVIMIVVALLATTHCACAQTLKVPGLTVLPPSYGPYSAHILQGGIGLTKPLPATDPILKASAPWTMSAWVEFSPAPTAPMLIAGAGDPRDEDSRFFAIVDGRLELRFGHGHSLRATDTLNPSGWHLLAASFDGSEAHLYVDGAEVAHGPAPGWPDPAANDDGSGGISVPRKFLPNISADASHYFR